MNNELKAIIASSETVVSCIFNDDDDMHITLSYGAENTIFIQSVIKFTLEEAMSTGENQIFLFSSSVHRDAFKHQVLELVHSLNIELDECSILSSGAMLSFILMDSKTSSGMTGHAYALSYFDDMSFNDFMLNWSIHVDRRAVFVSIE